MEDLDFEMEKLAFGKHVRRLRKKIPSSDYSDRNISLQELADKSDNITKKTLGEIERGQGNPTFETLIVLTKILKVSFSELMDYK